VYYISNTGKANVHLTSSLCSVYNLDIQTYWLWTLNICGQWKPV